MNQPEKLLIQAARRLYKALSRRPKLAAEPVEKYYGKRILSLQEGNDRIADLLEKPSPLIVTRMGAVETRCLYNYIQIDRFRSRRGIGKFMHAIKENGEGWNQDVRSEMANNAGFFPATDEELERFCIECLKNLAQIDVLGTWFLPNEEYFFHTCFPNATLVPLRSLEPYYHRNPWSKNLAQKKVLVVHPFEESILRQYERRGLLFPDGGDVLPEFRLQTLKAVQSIARNTTPFRDWFEAFDFMCGQIEPRDFDVAIIGAGAYGLPLAAFVKQLGKKAIHLGGATQILFGIKGKRWDTHEYISKLYNEHWVRPLPSEIPLDYRNVEGGCYW